MCIQYTCRGCKLVQNDYCKRYQENPLLNDPTHVVDTKPSWARPRRRCKTCVTIKGAIEQLRALLFREPWLESEGMAGAPKKAEWEAAEEEDARKKAEKADSNGEDSDGFSKEERQRIREEAAAAFLKRWGLLSTDEAEQP